jgi:hypothetical protein
MGFEFCEAHFAKAETDFISLVALTSAVLSMFGSSYMLLSYFLFSTRKNPLSQLVAWLAFCDYLVSLNNILKTSIIYSNSDLYVWPLCVSMRVFFQLAAGTQALHCNLFPCNHPLTYCLSVCGGTGAGCGYATCIAYFLWRSLWFHRTSAQPLPQSCHSLLLTMMYSCVTAVQPWEWALFHAFSWGVPLACVVSLVAGDLLVQSRNLLLCFPKKPWHISLWY